MSKDRNAGIDQRAHHVGMVRRRIDLDHIGAALGHESGCVGKRAVYILLDGAIGHVAAHQRAFHAAPHCFAADQHLIQRDVEHIGTAPQIDADRVADRDKSNPARSAIRAI
ncbi:MAG TPA: hypothetical protein VEK31_06995 [Xanthobacteraceae bacterium]|nr:hypothetical protein [Xanthobacteraceae bacterium]